MTPLGLERGWTPFPNALIDLIMPKLTDTEWRIIVVIVRQTLGWRNQGSIKRRAFDRLSHAQLKRKTGRQSAAISRAIESLHSQDLILIFDRDGNLASTPAERRRLHHSLSFGLAPGIHSFSTESRELASFGNSLSENNKRYLYRNIKEKRSISDSESRK